MSRRDYIAIAAILRENRADMGDSCFVKMVDQFATVFTEDNPRFDTDKFYEAVESELVS